LQSAVHAAGAKAARAALTRRKKFTTFLRITQARSTSHQSRRSRARPRVGAGRRWMQVACRVHARMQKPHARAYIIADQQIKRAETCGVWSHKRRGCEQTFIRVGGSRTTIQRHQSDRARARLVRGLRQPGAAANRSSRQRLGAGTLLRPLRPAGAGTGPGCNRRIPPSRGIRGSRGRRRPHPRRQRQSRASGRGGRLLDAPHDRLPISGLSGAKRDGCYFKQSSR